jgi:hypothetical protein
MGHILSDAGGPHLCGHVLTGHNGGGFMFDTDDAMLEELATSRAETRAAFENRALMYASIFDVLEEELGTEQATELMKKAIFKRGLEIGQKYKPFVDAGDLAGVGKLFVNGSPSEGALFEPGIEEGPRDGRIVLRMTGCPLAEAWQDAGLAPERVDLLCQIASAVDEGTFEAAGLDLEFLERQACEGSDTCLLELKARE